MSKTHTRALTPLSITEVDVDDDFWNRRRTVNREKTLWNQLEKLESRIENLERVAGWKEGGFEGPFHNDPPIYKWLEAASYVLEKEDNPELEEEVEEVIDVIEAAQDDDGYIHANFQLEQEKEERWTNLSAKHELFAVGHLAEAAVAHHQATGSERLLDVAVKAADHVCDVFGPNGNTGYPGHEETELAFVRLYRATGDEKYLDMAKFFIDMRGQRASRFRWEYDNEEYIAGGIVGLYDDDGEYDGTWSQDHKPVREQETAEGHAVKAVFLYIGMAEVATETGDDTLWETLEDLWRNVTEKRMYVTGGIGASHSGESFGGDYELPNQSAYAETCAAYSNIVWNQRLFEATAEGRFGDVLERTLYNGFLAGVSLDGTQFCYTNPLEDADEDRHRQPWYHTSCCPPNVARLLASLEKYIYATDDDDLYVNLYVGSEATTDLGGTTVTVDQDTDYPWSGEVEFEVDPEEDAEFGLRLRVPDWARDVDVEVEGESVDVETEDGFAVVDREWTSGDEVTVTFPTPVERVAAHPDVEENYGRVALQRGPLVYAAEAVDNDHNPLHVTLDEDADFETHHEDDLLEGVTVVEADAEAPDMDEWDGSLYRRRDDVSYEDTTLTAVPYYAWDNRDPGEMTIWVQN